MYKMTSDTSRGSKLEAVKIRQFWSRWYKKLKKVTFDRFIFLNLTMLNQDYAIDQSCPSIKMPPLSSVITTLCHMATVIFRQPEPRSACSAYHMHVYTL